MLQYQTESLSTLTEGAWTIRFDDMIADALELGPLRCTEPELPAELAERLEQIRPEKMPSNILPTPGGPTTWPTARRTATGWCSL